MLCTEWRQPSCSQGHRLKQHAVHKIGANHLAIKGIGSNNMMYTRVAPATWLSRAWVQITCCLQEWCQSPCSQGQGNKLHAVYTSCASHLVLKGMCTNNLLSTRVGHSPCSRWHEYK
ncbi:hypothetical protein DPMN_029972 [Dreissena polymorpha]|uniref:Uncharacterized protein n=1 Tax=Dreissena polymorpha TaxID=45954 RepID=A0A9D4RFY3_DREPO|nr:hypothetical protein DPMN_029972 [Dreissena polymorpha]